MALPPKPSSPPARRPTPGKPLLLALLALLLGGLVVAQPLAVNAQNLDALTEKRKALERQIRLTQRLVYETRQVADESFNELKLINKQIRLREQLLSSMQAELAQLDRSITQADGIVRDMMRDIQRLQTQYAEVVNLMYRNEIESFDLVLWLLSSESFEQAFRRLAYFRAFSRYRARQIQLIQDARAYMASRIRVLEDRKHDKAVLLRKELVARNKLAQTKRTQNRLVRNLRNKEARYKAQLEDQNRQLRKVQLQIRELVKASKTGQDKAILAQLSKTFERNKSKLPWPVNMSRGLVTSGFGRQPDESGGVVQNDGIYITTPKDEPVRAIFEGTVTAVKELPMVGYVVIVQHGRYRSVYTNLTQVSVKEGQVLETAETLGTVKTDRRSGESRLYFMLYDGFNPVDPQTWLARKVG